MSVHLFPLSRPEGGTIHVWGDRLDGFTVSHESASGGSWGEMCGPYASGQEAITAAVSLNVEYGGSCQIVACDAAAMDANPGVGLPSAPGDIGC
ncbi:MULTISPECIES: hypothetical protein [unclassified Sphingomonas]|uniref:hypothetical protein n=1 Tax=unclassified Sphingomonas TaxID=196159 RepID=UPI00226A6CDE|nr:MULTISPECIES: hypothetical protein [unclassified Sphingomonas]